MCEEKYILLRAFDATLDIMNIRTGEKLTIFPEEAKLYNIININEREKIADQLRRDNPYFVIIVGYVTLSLQQSLDEPNRIYILNNKTSEISEEYITAQPDKYYLVSINGKKEKWLNVYDLFIMQKRGCEIINGILKSENEIVLSCSILPYSDMSYSLEEIQPYIHVEVTEKSKNYISRIKLDFKFIPPHLKKLNWRKSEVSIVSNY